MHEGKACREASPCPATGADRKPERFGQQRNQSFGVGLLLSGGEVKVGGGKQETSKKKNQSPCPKNVKSPSINNINNGEVVQRVFDKRTDEQRHNFRGKAVQ